MIDEKNFQSRVQKIGELVNQLESIPDPEARAGAKQLVQALMDLHGAGLERILEVVFQSEAAGEQIIGDLGQDPLVSSLLILYGIHPEELQTRVERKLQQIQSKLHKLGVEATLLSTEGGDIRIHVKVEGHSCGSTGRTAQGIVEEAVYEAAPDMKSLKIDGLEEPIASGFFSVEKLIGAPQAGASMLQQAAFISSDGMD